MKLLKTIFSLILVSIIITSCGKDDPTPAPSSVNNNKQVIEAYFKGTVDDVDFDFTNGLNGYEMMPATAAGSGPSEGSYYVTYVSSVQKDSDSPMFQISFGSPIISDGDDRDDIESIFYTGTFTLGVDEPDVEGAYSIHYSDEENTFYSSADDNVEIEITEVTNLGLISIWYFGIIEEKTKAVRVKGTISEVTLHHATAGDKVLKNVTFSTVFTTHYDEEQ